jgi:hypothetical protein
MPPSSPEKRLALGAVVLAISARYAKAEASGDWPTTPTWAPPRTQRKPGSQAPEVAQ